MTLRSEPSPLVKTTTIFVGIAFICLVLSDVAITTVDPWQEFRLFLIGLITPDFYATDSIGQAIAYTLAFAFLGVALANIFGLFLALLFFSRIVRTGCAVVRAVHELFWALIFLQMFGLSPLTGVLAITIPYAGIIAKVYAEILEEANPAPLKTIPVGTSRISAFVFVRLPDVWAHFRSYSMYRLECGIRSSAVLGFIGLPTLGFHLETAFKEGQYSEVAALLFLFYIVIATMRFWIKRPLLPIYLIGAAAILPWGLAFSFSNIVRFLTEARYHAKGLLSDQRNQCHPSKQEDQSRNTQHDEKDRHKPMDEPGSDVMALHLDSRLAVLKFCRARHHVQEPKQQDDEDEPLP